MWSAPVIGAGPVALQSRQHSAAPRGCLHRVGVGKVVRRLCQLDTTILAGPSGAVEVGLSVAFSFSSNHLHSRFECRLDSADWRTCRSPLQFPDLSIGAHRFSVRAGGTGTPPDSTPAVRRFDVTAQSAEAPVPGGYSGVPGPEEGVPGPEEGGPGPEEGGPGGSTGLFASNSVWVTPVSKTTAVDPNSSLLVDTFLERIADEQAAGIGPSLGTRSRTTLYRVAPDQARVPVFLDTGPWGDLLAARMQAGVPIPEGAVPVEGQDHSMTVWQPSTDSYWEFSGMQHALHAPQFSRSPMISEGCAPFGGTYTYKLTSLNEQGETPAGVPPLKVHVPLGGGCVTIYWSPISGATGYRIYRGTDGSAVSYLATVTADRTSFVDDGLIAPDGAPPPITNTAETPGEWHASFGGFIPEASKSPGYYQDVKDQSGNLVEQSSWGASATGMPLAGGLITREDVEREQIDHALSLGLVNSDTDSILRTGSFAFPAQRADGRSTDPNSIPEGARLRLDPELDIDSLELSPFVHMLAEAAQRYGMIVHEGSQATVIYAEDPAPYVAQGEVNFYRPLIGWDSVRAMRKFPWSDLEVVQMHLCTTGPCAAS
jgi:hypothetical protein